MADEKTPDTGEAPEELTPPKYERTPREKWTMEKMATRVRGHLRDIEGKNHLDMGELKFSWGEIYNAIEEAFEHYNALSPLTQHFIDSIDLRAYHLIKKKACGVLLEAAAHEDTRNQLQYQDQGFSVVEHDKGQLYAQIAQAIEKEFDLKARRLKGAINRSQMWGGTHHHTYSDPFGGNVNNDVPGEWGV